MFSGCGSHPRLIHRQQVEGTTPRSARKRRNATSSGSLLNCVAHDGSAMRASHHNPHGEPTGATGSLGEFSGTTENGGVKRARQAETTSSVRALFSAAFRAFVVVEPPET